MTTLKFINARVYDAGYGLEVNGKDLRKIISTALGTRVDDNYGYGSGLSEFSSPCCNITIIIDPQPTLTCIEDDLHEYSSVEAMEEVRREQFGKKIAETDPEE